MHSSPTGFLALHFYCFSGRRKPRIVGKFLPQCVLGEADLKGIAQNAQLQMNYWEGFLTGGVPPWRSTGFLYFMAKYVPQVGT